jgi:hypothetical protein
LDEALAVPLLEQAPPRVLKRDGRSGLVRELPPDAPIPAA